MVYTASCRSGFKNVQKKPSAEPLYLPFKSRFTRENIISLYAYSSFNLFILQTPFCHKHCKICFYIDAVYTYIMNEKKKIFTISIKCSYIFVRVENTSFDIYIVYFKKISVIKRKSVCNSFIYAKLLQTGFLSILPVHQFIIYFLVKIFNICFLSSFVNLL